MRPGAAHQIDCVPDHVLGGRHPEDQILEQADLLGREHLLHLRLVPRGRRAHDLHLFLGARVSDVHHEHEPVELGLRQRIGPLLLDRVLRGEHQERLLQGIGVPARRHPVLLHRLQQCGLRLRRGAVDLVRQKHVCEYRPRHEAECAPSGGVVLLQHVGAGDVARHQVGCELDAVEGEGERLRQRRDEQGLRQSGHADEQAVAAREERDEELLDHRLLADDPLRDLVGDASAGAGELVDQLRVRGRTQRSVDCELTHDVRPLPRAPPPCAPVPPAPDP